MKLKSFVLAIVLIINCILLTSCNCNLPSKNDFTFDLVSPTLKVNCGDTVVYKAQLENKTDNVYTLSHGIPLITLYVYMPGEKPEDGVFSTLLETEIEENGTICKEISTRFTEAGEYMLRAYCSFTVEGEEFYYETDDLTIEVS